jgi:hypothetical protein
VCGHSRDELPGVAYRKGGGGKETPLQEWNRATIDTSSDQALFKSPLRRFFTFDGKKGNADQKVGIRVPYQGSPSESRIYLIVA